MNTIAHVESYSPITESCSLEGGCVSSCVQVTSSLCACCKVMSVLEFEEGGGVVSSMFTKSVIDNLVQDPYWLSVTL